MEDENQILKAESQELKEVREANKKHFEAEMQYWKAKIQSNEETIAMLQRNHSLGTQGQLSERGESYCFLTQRTCTDPESTLVDVYMGTVLSLDKTFEAHQRLPPHLRNVSVTIPYDSDITTYEFAIPAGDVEEVVKDLGLQRVPPGLDLAHILQTTDGPELVDEGADV